MYLMSEDSKASDIIIELVLDLEDCSLSEAILRSLIPESNLKLRGVSFNVSRVGCSVKLVFRASEPRALIPPLTNSLRLASMIIDVITRIH